MFYRENGQFKTSYAADQQIFTIAQDRYAILGLLAIAFLVIPLVASDYTFQAILIPFVIMSLGALGLNILWAIAGRSLWVRPPLWPWGPTPPSTFKRGLRTCPCSSP